MQVNQQKLNLVSLYGNANYMDIYGGSVVLTGTIVTGFFINQLSSYTNNIFKDMKKDWDQKRCKPYYMPFAGHVNPHPHKSKTQVAIENFNDCISGYSEGIFDNFRGPANSLTKSLMQIKLSNDIDKAKIRETIENERKASTETKLDMMDLGKILMTGGQRIIVQFRDFFHKIEAMFLTLVFSITGSMNLMAQGVSFIQKMVEIAFYIALAILIVIIGLIVAAIVFKFSILAIPAGIMKIIFLVIILCFLVLVIGIHVLNMELKNILLGSDLRPGYNESKYNGENITGDGSRGVLDIIEEEENIKDKYGK